VTTPRFRPADEIRRYCWIYLGLGIAFAIWGWVDVIPRGVVNRHHINEHRTDFTVYTEAGAAFFDGRDPYQVSNPRGWRYLYPPMFAILVAPLHALRPMWQVAVWYVLSVGMLFGCYFELRRILDAVFRRTDQGADGASRMLPWICAATIATALLPAFNCLQRGQVEVFKLYLLVLGFRIALTGTRVSCLRSPGSSSSRRYFPSVASCSTSCSPLGPIGASRMFGVAPCRSPAVSALAS
jgi:Glycosyltransferase family 87